MKKALLTAIAIAVLLISLAAGMQIAEAQTQPITIYADGSIDPSNAAIQKEGNTYVITSDLTEPINIERGNIVLNGANHTLQGPGSDKNFAAITLMASNVTVVNLRVTGWKAGVYGAYNNNTVTNNVFVGNYRGITLYSDDYVVTENNITGSDVAVLVNSGALRPQGDNNLIIRNQIASNNWAFDILNSNGTIIAENNVSDNSIILTLGTQHADSGFAGFHLLYLNNFVNNGQTLNVPIIGPFVSNAVTVSPAGQWDNGAVGNYWSDYASRYPNATEIGHSGIGDTPYLIEESQAWQGDYNGTHMEGTAVLGTAVDSYPLMAPNNISSSQLPYPLPSPSPSTTPFPSPSPTLTPTPSSSPTHSSSPTPTGSQQPESSSEPSDTKIPFTELVLATVAVIVAALVVVIVWAVAKKGKTKAQ